VAIKLSMYEFLKAQEAKEQMELLNPITVADALERAKGDIRRAAGILGVTSAEVRFMVNEDPDLRKVYDEIRELQLDEAENRLMAQVRKGNVPSIQFLLRTRGASRGYSERMEYRGDITQTVSGQVEHAIDSDTAETIFGILESVGAVPTVSGAAEDESVHTTQADS
jgi:hypothetical protein